MVLFVLCTLKFFTEQHLLANLLAIMILLLGVVSLLQVDLAEYLK